MILVKNCQILSNLFAYFILSFNLNCLPFLLLNLLKPFVTYLRVQSILTCQLFKLLPYILSSLGVVEIVGRDLIKFFSIDSFLFPILKDLSFFIFEAQFEMFLSILTYLKFLFYFVSRLYARTVADLIIAVRVEKWRITLVLLSRLAIAL